MRKLKTRSGFSLAETLITVAILAIVTAGGVVVAGQVIDTRNAMIETADSQVLAATALEALADEVRFGQEIVIEESTLTLNSTTFGYRAQIMLDNNRIVAVVNGETQDLLAEKAYTGLKITCLSFTEADGAVTISLTVEGRSGGAWSRSLTVRPLNGLKATATESGDGESPS